MMDDFNAELATALVSTMLGGSGPVFDHFEDDTFDQLANAHSIPEHMRLATRQILNIGRAAYHRESRRRDLDVKAIRKQLAHIEKAASQLRLALSGLAPEITSLMDEFCLAEVMQSDLPDLDSWDGRGPAELARSMFEDQAKPDDAHLDINSIRETAARLSEVAKGTVRYVGANRTGPRPDESLSTMFENARLVWTLILGRDFKLDWTDDHAPITDAARFCFDLARIVDPKVEPRKIRGAARTASEENIMSQMLGQIT